MSIDSCGLVSISVRSETTSLQSRSYCEVLIGHALVMPTRYRLCPFQVNNSCLGVKVGQGYLDLGVRNLGSPRIFKYWRISCLLEFSITSEHASCRPKSRPPSRPSNQIQAASLLFIDCRCFKPWAASKNSDTYIRFDAVLGLGRAAGSRRTVCSEPFYQPSFQVRNSSYRQCLG